MKTRMDYIFILVEFKDVSINICKKKTFPKKTKNTSFVCEQSFDDTSALFMMASVLAAEFSSSYVDKLKLRDSHDFVY